MDKMQPALFMQADKLPLGQRPAVPPPGLDQPVKPVGATLDDQTVHSFRADLIARCLPAAALPEAIPVPIEDELPTRRYPTDSFVKDMLTSPEPPPTAPSPLQSRLRQGYGTLCLWAVMLLLAAALAAHGTKRSPPPAPKVAACQETLPLLCYSDLAD